MQSENGNKHPPAVCTWEEAGAREQERGAFHDPFVPFTRLIM